MKDAPEIEGQRRLRIAIVQFAPILGRVDENLKKATEICSRIKPGSVDLVCLPEMIMTGYKFRDADAILPFLEVPRDGPTSTFCKVLSQKLRCCVIAGYPEKKADDIELMREDGSRAVGYNSAIICDHDGTFLGNYRKVNMFETDKSWAHPGKGFMTWSMPSFPPQYQTLSVAICMDLNPRPPVEWTFSNGPFELADYCRSATGKTRTNVLVLLNAWLDSGENEVSNWDNSTLRYWSSRLRPLWDVDHAGESGSDGEVSGTETIVVVCNRCGIDDDAVFAGTSAMFRLREGSGEPEVIGLMGRHEEGFRLYEV